MKECSYAQQGGATSFYDKGNEGAASFMTREMRVRPVFMTREMGV